MTIITYLFFPILAFVVAYISQYFFDQDEFEGYIKFFFIGIIFGVVYRLLFGFIDDMTVTKPHPVTVLLKLFFVDGLFITLLAAVIVYMTVYFIGVIHVNTDWRNTTFILSGLMIGFFTVYSFYYAKIHFTPNSILYFLHTIGLLIISVVLTGYGLSKYEEGYSAWDKAFSVLMGVLLPAVVLTLFRALYFYNSPFYILSIPAAAIPSYIYIKNELQ